MRGQRVHAFAMLVLIPVLMGLGGCSSADQRTAPAVVYRFYEGERAGYMDKAGKVVIEPKFYGGPSGSWNGMVSVVETERGEPYTIDFSGNKIKAIPSGIFIQPSDNEKYAEFDGTSSGLINKEGRQFTYDFVGSRSTVLGLKNDGVFTIKTNGRYALFSEKDGTSLVSQEYLSVGVYSEGLVAVMVGEDSNAMLGFIDKAGKVAIPPTFLEVEMTAALAQDLKATVFDYVTLPAHYRFSEGLAAVGLMSDDGHPSYGYIDKKGSTNIKPAFTQARPFSEGYAAAGIGGDVFGKGTQYGYIDKSGRFIVPPRFDEAMEVKNGVALVRIGKKWGFLNIASWKKTGKLVVEPAYGYIERCGELFLLYSKDDSNDWVDANGTAVRPHI